MFLSAKQIEEAVGQGEMIIAPFEAANLKGASYSFTLDKKVRVLKTTVFLDSREEPKFEEIEMGEDGYELKPGDFGVFLTKEKVTLNNKFACLLSTRATLAQMGLNVTQGSFFAEPDTDNQFTLEISNNGPLPIKLYPGVKIVKGVFSAL